jgi:hypothetical protein
MTFYRKVNLSRFLKGRAKTRKNIREDINRLFHIKDNQKGESREKQGRFTNLDKE